jgi:hypothetical protein
VVIGVVPWKRCTRPCVRRCPQSFGNDAATTFRAWRSSFSVPTETGGSLLLPVTRQGPGCRRILAPGYRTSNCAVPSFVGMPAAFQDVVTANGHVVMQITRKVDPAVDVSRRAQRG